MPTKKSALHPDTQWVLDLINEHAQPRKLTKLKEDLADAIGMARTTIFTYLKGESPFDAEQLMKVAEFFGVDPPESCRTKGGKLLLEGPKKMLEGPRVDASDTESNVVQLRPTPAGMDSVTFPVEGVTFDGYRLPENVKQPRVAHIIGMRSSEYPNAKHVAWESGDLSMNKKGVVVGTYAFCVDFKDAGEPLKNGWFVVVERRKAGMVERMIREVVVGPDGVSFEPRTTANDPNFTPFPYKSDESVSVEILAVVFYFSSGELI